MMAHEDGMEWDDMIKRQIAWDSIRLVIGRTWEKSDSILFCERGWVIWGEGPHESGS